MKYFLIYFVLVCSSTAIFASDSIPQIGLVRHKLSINKLIGLQFIYAQERVYAKHLSIQAGGGILFKAHYLETLDRSRELIFVEGQKFSSFFINRSPAVFGFQTTIEPRFYLEKSDCRGLFVGGKVTYEYVDFGNITVFQKSSLYGEVQIRKTVPNAKQNKLAYGAIVGFTPRYRKGKVYFEIYLTYGKRMISLISPVTLPPPTSSSFATRFMNGHQKKIHQRFMSLDFNICFKR